MATVKMRKGNLYADINSAEECVNNALNEGYVFVSDDEAEEIVSTESVEEKRTEESIEEEKPVIRRGRRARN